MKEKSEPSRRGFLKSLSTATAAVVIGTNVFAAEKQPFAYLKRSARIGPNDQINLALIGCILNCRRENVNFTIKKSRKMESKAAVSPKALEGNGNTITDEELEALNLSSRQIALLLTKSLEVRELDKINSFYDYEKEYIRIVKDIGRQAMEKQLGDAGKDRRKKKHF